MTLKRICALAAPLLTLWFVFSEPVSLRAQTTTNTARVTAEVETAKGTNAVTTVMTQVQRPEALSFGLDRVPVLTRTVMGAPLWRYLASAIFILLALYVSKLLDYVVGSQLKRWAARTRTKLDDLLVSLIHGPVKIISFVVLLHMGLPIFPWPVWIDRWVSKGLQLVVACSVTYMVLKFVDVLVEYWGQRAKAREDRVFNDQLFPVVSKSFKGFVIVVAVLVTSQNLGLDITAMLASLSIGGLALGLAAQDTVANLFGAVAVFVDKPFKVGDRIKLDAIDGTVESIGLRSTRVRNLDGHLITVPNKTMGNATITNITRRPNIKTEMNIGITYDTPADKVQLAVEILKEVYGKHSMTQDLVVAFNRFADSALNINVVHWWASTDHRAYLAGMEEMNLTIKRRFDAAGIEFAYPTQTLYVKQEPGTHNGHAEPAATGRPS